MVLLEILLAGGLFAGVALSAIVYADCLRRGVPTRRRLLRTFSFGAVGFTGFLVPYAYSGQLRYVYFHVMKPRPIATSPFEWLGVTVATGLLIAVLSLLFYFVESRFNR